jgi:hypothetical protein
MSFQKIITLVAVTVLVISLVIIGVPTGYGTDENWPPIVAECPDYWVLKGGKESSKCINVRDLGRCPPSNGDKHLEMDFSAYPFDGANSTCAKSTWAHTCNIPWDGVSYGIEDPCAETTE